MNQIANGYQNTYIERFRQYRLEGRERDEIPRLTWLRASLNIIIHHSLVTGAPSAVIAQNALPENCFTEHQLEKGARSYHTPLNVKCLTNCQAMRHLRKSDYLAKCKS